MPRQRGAPYALDLDTEERFGPLETDCRIWKWAKTGRGYGSMKVGGRHEYAHRYFWMRENGPIPSGLVLDHLCEIRGCCNPTHLRLCEQVENVQTYYNARKR